MIKQVLKIVSAMVKFISKSAVITVFICSLFINGILLFYQTGAVVIGSALHAVTGISTVAHQQYSKKIQQEKAIQKISSRVSKRTARGALRNVATMPAEVLPFIGLGVVVGVTALEIKEACETMKDLDELNQLIGVADIDGDEMRWDNISWDKFSWDNFSWDDVSWDNMSADNTTGDNATVHKVCGIQMPSFAQVAKRAAKVPKTSLEKAKEWGIGAPNLDQLWKDQSDEIEKPIQ